MAEKRRLFQSPKAFRETICDVALAALAASLVGGFFAIAIIGFEFLISPWHLGDGYDFLESWMMIEDLERDHDFRLKSPDYSWLERKKLEYAASKGNGRAIFKLGLMHELGLGYPKDEDTALGYYMEDFKEGYHTGEMSYRAARIYIKKGDCGGVSYLYSSYGSYPSAS